MKKYALKILIVLIFSFLITTKSYCADIDLSKSFISDKGGFLEAQVYSQLEDVLKNLHKETSSDLVLITLNSLAKGEDFNSIERDVRTRYILGGENRDNWVMVIAVREPYSMNIRVGDGLKKVIPAPLTRAMGIEFWLSKIINGRGNNFVTRLGVQTNLYTTVLVLGEAIADEKGVRLHTSDIVYDIYGYSLREQGIYIPRTTDAMKFIRRHNLYPAIIILTIGLFPFVLFRRRLRRRLFSRRHIDF